MFLDEKPVAISFTCKSYGRSEGQMKMPTFVKRSLRMPSLIDILASVFSGGHHFVDSTPLD